jgi:parallel beta-helix repeat protein
MRKNMLSKTLVMGVIVMFICVGFTSISGIQINNQIIKSSGRGDILYVGGSGEGNYSKIQDAVDNASDGDTVFVYNGTYDSDDFIITINISIRLVGENKFNTIIYGMVIEINASNVEISGFTLQNSIGIMIMPFFKDTNNNTISGNIFRVDEFGLGGVTIFSSNYSTVSDNSFFNCGLWMMESHQNTIKNNTVNGKPLVYFEDASDKVIDNAGQVILLGCNNISIKNLELSNTLFGIQLIDTVNCLVSDNDLSNNAIAGLLFNSSHNNISGNIFSKNAAGLTFGDCKSNKISRNSFENNGFGLVFIMSSCNHISYNNFKYQFGSLNRNIFSNESDNTWIGNFWNRPRILPVLIWNFKRSNFRYLLFLPTSPDVDWRPAKQPNDINGVKGHWSILESTIPGNRMITIPLFLNFLEQFPLLQKLLQQLGFGM